MLLWRIIDPEMKEFFLLSSPSLIVPGDKINIDPYIYIVLKGNKKSLIIN